MKKRNVFIILLINLLLFCYFLSVYYMSFANRCIKLAVIQKEEYINMMNISSITISCILFIGLVSDLFVYYKENSVLNNIKDSLLTLESLYDKKSYHYFFYFIISFLLLFNGCFFIHNYQKSKTCSSGDFDINKNGELDVQEEVDYIESYKYDRWFNLGAFGILLGILIFCLISVNIFYDLYYKKTIVQ